MNAVVKDILEKTVIIDQLGMCFCPINACFLNGIRSAMKKSGEWQCLNKWNTKINLAKNDILNITTPETIVRDCIQLIDLNKSKSKSTNVGIPKENMATKLIEDDDKTH